MRNPYIQFLFYSYKNLNSIFALFKETESNLLMYSGESHFAVSFCILKTQSPKSNANCNTLDVGKRILHALCPSLPNSADRKPACEGEEIIHISFLFNGPVFYRELLPHMGPCAKIFTSNLQWYFSVLQKNGFTLDSK